MKKKYSYFLSLLLALSGAYSIKAQTTYAGYSTTEQNVATRFSANSHQGIAVCIPKSKLKELKGAEIIGLRTAFKTLLVNNLNLFVTEDLNAVPLVKTTGKKSFKYSDYYFPQPVPVGEKPLYAGCDLNLSNETLTPFSFDGESFLGKGLVYALNNNAWETLPAASEVGAPNLQLILRNAPNFTDLILKPLKVEGFYKSNNAYTFNAEVFNFGTQTVRDLRFTVQVGNDKPLMFTKRFVNLSPNHSYKVTTPEIKINGDGVQTLTIRVEDPAQNDGDASDNIQSAKLGVVPVNIDNKVLIEDFTSQYCPNCPNGHRVLHRVGETAPENYVIVSHHSGYRYDSFTMPEDIVYEQFYGGILKFAPGAMINRVVLPNNNNTLVYNAQAQGDLSYAYQECLKKTPPVSIKLDNYFDPATQKGKLYIHVKVYFNPSPYPHKLNVYLTQDHIKAFQAAGGSNYYHNDVFRGTLTGTDGMDIDLAPGEDIEKQIPYTIPKGITSRNGEEISTDPSNMHFVVFVSDLTKNPENKRYEIQKCQVYNTQEIRVNNVTLQGINKPSYFPIAIKTEGNQVYVSGDFRDMKLYDMAGNLLKRIPRNTSEFRLEKGLYILQAVTMQGQVNNQKLVIR